MPVKCTIKTKSIDGKPYGIDGNIVVKAMSSMNMMELKGLYCQFAGKSKLTDDDVEAVNLAHAVEIATLMMRCCVVSCPGIPEGERLTEEDVATLDDCGIMDVLSDAIQELGKLPLTSRPGKTTSKGH